MTKGGRELQLDKRDKFFNDPIFQDILAHDDKSLHRKLDLFRQKDTALATLGDQQEAAHNLQVTVSNDRFLIQLELPGFSPEEFNLKTRDDVIVLEADHRAAAADRGTEYTERHYKKEFQMPSGVQPEHLKSSYSSSGILTIEAPRVVTAPEGAAIQEAMAAKSKAYTTDDGKTSVNEKSQASSQVIAAATESPDGRTKSSMTYSSSSSSSSSVVTSGGPMGGNMSMPPMPSLMGDFGRQDQMSLEMDDMMKRMMGNMNMGSNSSNRMMNMNMPDMNMGFPDMNMGMGMGPSRGHMMSRMNNPMSSSQSQSFSSNMSSTSQHFGGGPAIGPGFGFGRGGLDIEELSNAGTPDPSASPRSPGYTVTSPPPSAASPTPSATSTTSSSSRHRRDGDGYTSHRVAPAASDSDSDSGVSSVGSAGFRSQRDPQADHTVLLKLREGSEYKLVLNMQQYPPENITVKLNDRELTVLANAGAGRVQDDFVQRHLVPDGIDLDQLTSTFSADGILVIKAPRLKKGAGKK